MGGKNTTDHKIKEEEDLGRGDHKNALQSTSTKIIKTESNRRITSII